MKTLIKIASIFKSVSIYSSFLICIYLFCINYGVISINYLSNNDNITKNKIHHVKCRIKFPNIELDLLSEFQSKESTKPKMVKVANICFLQT